MKSSYIRFELGRRVMVEDLLPTHPGRPDRCLCRGACRVTVHKGGKPVTLPCNAALTAFNAQCGNRVSTDALGDARWIRGGSPEEWPFAQMFDASMRDFEWRAQMRKLSFRST